MARRWVEEVNGMVVVVAAVVAVDAAAAAAVVGCKPHIAAGVIAVVGEIGHVEGREMKQRSGPEGNLLRRMGHWVDAVRLESSSMSRALGGWSMCFGGGGRFGAVGDKGHFGLGVGK